VDHGNRTTQGTPRGELYRKAAGKAVSNSVFAFDPSGKTVCFQRALGVTSTRSNVPALTSGDQGLSARKKADAKTVTHRQPIGTNTFIFRSKPTQWVVPRDLAHGQRAVKAGPGRNGGAATNMWVRKDEVAMLAKGQLPDSLKKRIARLPLHQYDRRPSDLGRPCWKAEHVKRLDIAP